MPAYKDRSLFKFRTRMNQVRCNFKQSFANLSCPLCLVSEDRDEHLLQCVKIKEKCVNIRQNISSKYMDIFSSSIEKMVASVDLLEEAMKVRKDILESGKKNYGAHWILRTYPRWTNQFDLSSAFLYTFLYFVYLIDWINI